MIEKFDIVCSTYCALLKEVLQKQYGISTELITTDFDVFKHVVLLLKTKKRKQVFNRSSNGISRDES